MKEYGQHLILDIHGCDTDLFNRDAIRRFMKLLCKEINMTRSRLYFWDYDSEEERNAAPSHLAGVSAVQFITTSTITLHTLDKLRLVYLDIFSCKTFQQDAAIKFCENWFRGTVKKSTFITRA